MVVYPPETVTPSVSIKGKESITEGNSGNKNVSIDVTLSESTTNTVSLDYATKNQSAVAGSDYSASSGTLTFLPGETSKKIKIKISGDVNTEADETFKVNISNPVNAILDKKTCTVTILNDDAFFARSIKSTGNTSEPLLVKASPNPVKTTLNISGIQPAGNHYIQLVNSSGSTLLNRTVTGNIETIDVSKFSTGIYWLRYFDGDAWQSLKIVKE